MTYTEIALYIIALVLFPFVVQVLTVPLLLLADLIEKIGGKHGKH